MQKLKYNLYYGHNMAYYSYHGIYACSGEVLYHGFTCGDGKTIYVQTMVIANYMLYM